MFPSSERVIYAKNPLAQVICQLKFPTILSISSKAPAEYQEYIRQQYPLFSILPTANLGQGLPQEILRTVFAKLPSEITNPTYQFSSRDEQWVLHLNQDHLTLTSRNYRRWEEFEEHLAGPLRAVLEQYRPSFFSRIGLRYQNVIYRSRLGLDGVDWSALLKPHIAGILSSEGVSGNVEHSYAQVILRLEQYNRQVRVSHGLAQDKNTRETLYMIDSDFFTEEKTDVPDAIPILHYFNRHSGQLFRWCITDTLHHAMEPNPVG